MSTVFSDIKQNGNYMGKSVVGHCSNNFTKKKVSALHYDRRGEANMGITTTFLFASS